MKLTETELKQVIQEEIAQAIEEGRWDQLKAKASGTWAGTKGIGKRALGGLKYTFGGVKPDEVDPALTKAGGTKIKIIDIHKKKWEKLMRTLTQQALDLAEDAKTDLDKLAPDSESAQRVKNIMDQVTGAAGENEDTLSQAFGVVLRELGSGEKTE